MCSEKCVSRRKFLQVGAKSASVLALTGPVSSVLSALGKNAHAFSGPPPVNIPNNPDNVYQFGFSDYPQLANAGGSVHALIQATSGKTDIYVSRVTDALAESVSSICPHRRCIIGSYNAATQQYTCPCHGSVFGADGSLVEGPAFEPLDTYITSIKNHGIEVVVP
jgi:Rieske Fe-S protein